MVTRLTKGRLKVTISETRAELGEVAAREVGAYIRSLLETQPEVNIIFASAPSQNDFLANLLLEEIDWSRVNAFHMDEYIGIVQQDVYLFAGNVMDNIRYGRPEASEEEVIAAAKAANAHDFIMELPNGYNTDIGQRGVKLSGGQKQRLSIARVFLKNPPILIFDEATSALDNESEKVVQDSLERLARNRTTFVIAHRLSTIRNARRIVVLGEEGILEQGNHAELMAADGAYAHLYRMQFEH